MILLYDHDKGADQHVHHSLISVFVCYSLSVKCSSYSLFIKKFIYSHE